MDAMARIIGDVSLGEGTVLWPGVIIEGDKTEVGRDVIIMPNVRVGKKTSIGDGSFMSPGARLEGCTIGKNCFLGMDSFICCDASIGDGSLIASGTVVKEGTIIPRGSLVKGVPGKVEGTVTDEMIRKIEDIRSLVNWQKEEVRIMMRRGELFGVTDIPKRPVSKMSELKERDDIGTDIHNKFLKSLETLH